MTESRGRRHRRRRRRRIERRVAPAAGRVHRPHRVVERDPTYTRASSFLAMGGIRQQFCTPVTVQMVQFSVQLWKTFDQQLGTPARARARGSGSAATCFSPTQATSTALMKRYEEERRAGAVVQNAVGRRDPRRSLPDVMLDDILFGVIGPEDGYANPREVLVGFRRGAEAAGAEYRRRRGRRPSIAPADASPASRSRAARRSRLPWSSMPPDRGPGALAALAGAAACRSNRCGKCCFDACCRSNGRTASRC